MSQYCICKTNVAFGVLEIYRVNFMWHGAGADFTVLQALTEIAERDVAP